MPFHFDILLLVLIPLLGGILIGSGKLVQKTMMQKFDDLYKSVYSVHEEYIKECDGNPLPDIDVLFESMKTDIYIIMQRYLKRKKDV